MRAAGKPVILIVLLCTAIGVACYLFARSKSPGVTTSASSGSGNMMLLLLGGVLVVAGLGGLAYYFVRSKR